MRAETRRQLKQDKFSKATLQVAEQTVHWSAEHKGKLIAGLVAVVIIVAAVLGGFYYLNMQDQRASVEFGKAVQTLSEPIRPAGMPPQPDYPSFASANERATEAHKQFEAIAQKYPHTHAADFAHYFLGVTSSQRGDTAAAERELKPVTEYHNADISALAKLALASVYRNSNRNKDAEGLYNELIQKPTSTVSKISAQMQLAETYVADAKPSDAKKIYEQIQKDSPQSEAAQLASNRLQELK